MSTVKPRTVQRVRSIEDTLAMSLVRWGYQEIIPPTFEYVDVLSAGLDPSIIEKCYTFADRTTGRMLLLRPDVTAQIARIVAMGMVESHIPLRLSYRTTVFRYEPEHAGREREIFQVGAELIGLDHASQDAEIIALMIDCLKRIGLATFTISLGHVGFFQALLAKAGLSQEGRRRAEHAAARKDLPRLEEILGAERVPAGQARAVLEAPGLYGRREVLERGLRLAGRDRRLRAPLGRLRDVYRVLEAVGLSEYLVLDLGEFRGFDYYDGVVFDVFAGGLGYELGGGGRYNHLFGKFGRDLPATGFAFDVDRLFSALNHAGNGTAPRTVDFVVMSDAVHLGQLFRVADRLRAAGLCVVQGVSERRGAGLRQEAVALARRIGAQAAVVVGLPNLEPEEAWVMSTGDGAKSKTTTVSGLTMLASRTR
jgi:ATP phosphoribosyltransferase regulatory subunit